MANPKTKIGILLSGGGTTLQNLAELIAQQKLDAKITVVISSNPAAYGLTRAKAFHIPTFVIPRKAFDNAQQFSEAIASTLRNHQVELVCLAGYLQLWPIPSDFAGRVLNIHPALLPKFGGKGMHGFHVHQAVLAAHEKESGCTVHFADNTYDTGPILLQRRCPVLPNDTPETLAARVFAEECLAYPEAIRMWQNGKRP
jgi:formyltetrahydrofolate-dependent phosphoribosylglycinamide formyltransferase